MLTLTLNAHGSNILHSYANCNIAGVYNRIRQNQLRVVTGVHGAHNGRGGYTVFQQGRDPGGELHRRFDNRLILLGKLDGNINLTGSVDQRNGGVHAANQAQQQIVQILAAIAQVRKHIQIVNALNARHGYGHIFVQFGITAANCQLRTLLQGEGYSGFVNSVQLDHRFDVSRVQSIEVIQLQIALLLKAQNFLAQLQGGAVGDYDVAVVGFGADLKVLIVHHQLPGRTGSLGVGGAGDDLFSLLAGKLGTSQSVGHIFGVAVRLNSGVYSRAIKVEQCGSAQTGQSIRQVSLGGKTGVNGNLVLTLTLNAHGSNILHSHANCNIAGVYNRVRQNQLRVVISVHSTHNGRGFTGAQQGRDPGGELDRTPFGHIVGKLAASNEQFAVGRLINNLPAGGSLLHSVFLYRLVGRVFGGKFAAGNLNIYIAIRKAAYQRQCRAVQHHTVAMLRCLIRSSHSFVFCRFKGAAGDRRIAAGHLNANPAGNLAAGDGQIALLRMINTRGIRFITRIAAGCGYRAAVDRNDSTVVRTVAGNAVQLCSNLGVINNQFGFRRIFIHRAKNADAALGGGDFGALVQNCGAIIAGNAGANAHAALAGVNRNIRQNHSAHLNIYSSSGGFCVTDSAISKLYNCVLGIKHNGRKSITAANSAAVQINNTRFGYNNAGAVQNILQQHNLITVISSSNGFRNRRIGYIANLGNHLVIGIFRYCHRSVVFLLARLFGLDRFFVHLLVFFFNSLFGVLLCLRLCFLRKAVVIRGVNRRGITANREHVKQHTQNQQHRQRFFDLFCHNSLLLCVLMR